MTRSTIIRLALSRTSQRIAVLFLAACFVYGCIESHYFACTMALVAAPIAVGLWLRARDVTVTLTLGRDLPVALPRSVAIATRWRDAKWVNARGHKRYPREEGNN